MAEWTKETAGPGSSPFGPLRHRGPRHWVIQVLVSKLPFFAGSREGVSPPWSGRGLVNEGSLGTKDSLSQLSIGAPTSPHPTPPHRSPRPVNDQGRVRGTTPKPLWEVAAPQPGQRGPWGLLPWKPESIQRSCWIQQVRAPGSTRLSSGPPLPSPLPFPDTLTLLSPGSSQPGNQKLACI